MNGHQLATGHGLVRLVVDPGHRASGVVLPNRPEKGRDGADARRALAAEALANKDRFCLSYIKAYNLGILRD